LIFNKLLESLILEFICLYLQSCLTCALWSLFQITLSLVLVDFFVYSILTRFLHNCLKRNIRQLFSDSVDSRSMKFVSWISHVFFILLFCLFLLRLFVLLLILVLQSYDNYFSIFSNIVWPSINRQLFLLMFQLQFIMLNSVFTLYIIIKDLVQSFLCFWSSRELYPKTIKVFWYPSLSICNDTLCECWLEIFLYSYIHIMNDDINMIPLSFHSMASRGLYNGLNLSWQQFHDERSHYIGWFVTWDFVNHL
jgi:hypothetical protein